MLTSPSPDLTVMATHPKQPATTSSIVGLVSNRAKPDHKVLVVDDDPGMRQILRQILESKHLQVIEARNGQEALELYALHSPCLILLDAVMPVMDGFTCCRQLCQSHQPCPAPVLMVTSLDDEASIRDAFEAGAIDYVTKPINLPVFCQRVQWVIQQFQLMQQVQQMNEELENYAQTLNLTVREQTADLRRSLEFESTLKHITDRVRDSLNEETILQTVVQELSWTLELNRCNVAIYEAEQRVSRVRQEYRVLGPSYQNRVIQMEDYPELYQQLLQGESVQFCSLVVQAEEDQCALLAFPIKNQDVMGDIWLVSSAGRVLSDLEVRLVQQVTNQCAIALRQARLYESAQVQIQELERLNRLKDDFLSTVSHELRSPMSNIKMATHMLDLRLNHLDILTDETKAIRRYFDILQEEGQREISLINDLLDLTRLDAETDLLEFTDVNLQAYLFDLTEPFVERMAQKQQQFILNIPATLPLLTTDIRYLERILSELLQNACKYTPVGEKITLSAQVISDRMEIHLSNSGVEVAPAEYERIFDKFYRIPNSDPWKCGGTGLGLAIVKKLVNHLGGNIYVKSGDGQTSFVVSLKAGS